MKRFGVLVLGAGFLVVGVVFGFIPTSTRVPVGAIVEGSYKPIRYLTNTYQPIVLEVGGGWLIACIIIGTALVAGWTTHFLISPRRRATVPASAVR